MRIKFCLDCAKGIQYLHNNDILHRDIKPDNLLVISLEENVPVNAKLTDFGSSRNVNQMITNLTFTKGIGSPKYMAPEILNRDKYKKPADIYSFAITMLEIMIWNDTYPKTLFKFAWSIADFVCQGNRPNTIDEIESENMKKLIEFCWNQNPIHRLPIKEIVLLLEEELKINCK